LNQQNIVLAVILVVLAVAAGLFVRWRIKLRQARTWPTAAGQVDSTLVRLQSTGQNQSKFFAYVQYSYGVQGTAYSGSLNRSFMIKGSADKWVGKYATGQPLKIRYNPKDAKDSMVFEDEQGAAGVV
jgi:hypothetical protein